MPTRRVRNNNVDEIDEVHDQYYRDNYYENKPSNNWLPLLMIPLMIIGILAVFPYISGTTNPNNPNTIQNNVQPGTGGANPNNTESNPQFGVGGGPQTPSDTPTPTMKPSVTPSTDKMNLDLGTTREPTP